jgi:Mitochondrial fission ELM1
MSSITRLCTTLLTLFCLLPVNLAFSSQTFIIFLDQDQMGDKNQALGVYEAYQRWEPNTQKVEIPVNDRELLRTAVTKAAKEDEKKPIVLAVGEKTVIPLSEVLPLKEAITVHLCHMVTTNHEKLIDKVDHLALPAHTISQLVVPKESRTKLIETIGVAHNRQVSQIEKACNENTAKLPQAAEFMGVMLGGDAPTPEGKILLFTEDNARQLARFIAKEQGNRHLVITNGPRTGKFDPKTMEENKTVHRMGVKDPVTLAFVEELEKNLVKPEQYTLFDFQFGQKSDMDVILGLLRAHKAELYVPGESTSSISESIDVMPDHAVTVYENVAMNEVHKAHVKSEVGSVRVSLLPLEEDGYKYVQRSSKYGLAHFRKVSAAEHIAATLRQLG